MTSVAVYLVVLLALIAVATGKPDFHKRTRRSPNPGLFDKVTAAANDKLPITIAQFNAFKDQLTNLGNLSETLQKAIDAEKKGRSALQSLVETAKERIAALENSVYPDENNYWSESVTCGGLMVSQTGKISYKPETIYENYERCVWTVRTNYRSKIKVQLNVFGLAAESGYDILSVSEILPNGTIKTTMLSKAGSKYVFEGPLLIITFTSDWHFSGTGFLLEFEGVGKNVNTDFDYKHFHLTDWLGSFSSDNLTLSKPSTKKVSKPAREFTTWIIAPNFKNLTKLKIQVNDMTFSPAECNKVSIAIYESYREENGMINRCCDTKCEYRISESLDGIILMILNVEKGATTTFNFSWEIETEVPRANSVDTCGGILTGRAGQIVYKVDKEYDNNERCVWVIQTTGKSQVKFVMQDNFYEEGYDFVSINSVDSDFNITTINKLLKIESYNFSSSVVVFVTFYSDGSTVEKGFRLDWEEYGNRRVESLTDTLYFDKPSGEETISLESEKYGAIFINSKYLDSSALNLKIDAFDSKRNFTCGSSGLYVYGNDETDFSEAKRYCDNEDFLAEGFGSSGGIFVMLFRDIIEQEVNKLSISWEKGAAPEVHQPEGQQYVNQSEGCGGILLGDLGKIEYKLNEVYENNARCTWIVQTKTLSKVTFKLTKDGFESCCDFLIATPFNPENGSLGESVVINRANKIESFPSQLVFITFYSDGSFGTKGFSLEFSSGGEVRENPSSFMFHMLETPSGEVTLPSNPTVDSKGNVFIVHVLSPKTEEDKEMKSTDIVVHTTGFESARESCSKNIDTLSFFKIQKPKQDDTSPKRFDCFHNLESKSDVCNPDGNAGAVVSSSFTITDTAFISVLKICDHSGKNEQFTFNWTLHDSATSLQS